MIISNLISLTFFKIAVGEYVSSPEFSKTTSEFAGSFLSQFLGPVKVNFQKINSKGLLGIEIRQFSIVKQKKNLIVFSNVQLSLSLLSLISNPQFNLQLLDGKGGQINASTVLNKDLGKFEEFKGNISSYSLRPLLGKHFSRGTIQLSDWVVEGTFQQVNEKFQFNGRTTALNWKIISTRLKLLRKVKKIPGTLAIKPFDINFEKTDSKINFMTPIIMKSKLGRIQIKGNLVQKQQDYVWNASVRSKGSIFIPFITKALFKCPRRSGLNFDIKGPVTRPFCQRSFKR
jgi:hypothetical protein